MRDTPSVCFKTQLFILSILLLLPQKNEMIKYNLCFLACLLSFASIAQRNTKELDSLKLMLSSAKEDSIKVKYQIGLGKHFLFTDPRESEKWFVAANQISIKPIEKDIANKAFCANSLVQVNFVMGKLPEAEHWLNIAIDLANKSKQAEIISNAYLNASTLYSQTQRFDKAIPYCQRILSIYDSLGTPEKSVKAMLTLGNIFVQLPKYDKALLYYGKVATLQGKDMANKDYALLTAYNGIAYVYQQKRQFDSCLLFANKAHEYALKYPQPDLYSIVLATKAAALEQLNKDKEVLPTAREGMNICVENNVNHYRVIFYATIARAFAKNKQLDSAVFYAQLADKWKDSSNIPSRFVEMNNTWAAVYGYAGDYKKAYDYKEKAYQAYELIKEEEVTAQTAAADALYETSKKEAQIDALAKETQAQRKAQIYLIIGLILALASAIFAYFSFVNKRKLAATLEQSNREKEVFLKEIHHRVKNNLQIISSLLYLQFKDNEDEKMIAQLKQAQDRIKSMSLVHNKLYETSDVVNVKIKEYMTDLAVGILSSNTPAGKQIKLSVEADDSISFSLDTSISLGLMLNELITNSCKYAFTAKNQGTIHISMVQQGDQYILEVKDDGSGLADNFDQKNSLGLKLVKNMARQMRGKVQFLNDNGTVVQITLNKMAA
jgi:two-component system, sensor histidine kinase PdtaS